MSQPTTALARLGKNRDKKTEEKVSLENTEHLGDGLYVATWSFVDGGFIHDTLVSTEFEPKDPSVGYFSSYFYADGECPQQVLDKVAEEESFRMEDLHDSDEDNWRNE